MTERDLPRVMERLERLEHQSRRLKAVGGLLVLSVLAVGLMGQAVPQGRTVEAETFVVRDASGRPRAALALGKDDRPGLALADKSGKIRAWLNLETDGSPDLRFYDREEKVRAQLAVDAAGAPALSLTDATEHQRARLAVRADGAPRLLFYDKGDRVRALLGVEPDQSPLMVLTDEAQGRATLVVRSSGPPTLVITARDGKVLWRAPAGKSTP
ncbi:MAG: hypothetical protein HY727_08500 [Candidatus Rokubacteria bacterium]|nr:hypothetical protein [Candidatus Rokubacteria bacterium]